MSCWHDELARQKKEEDKIMMAVHHDIQPCIVYFACSLLVCNVCDSDNG
jgi:hypothetical protein